YERLGHDNKKDIVRCYEEAFLGSSAHPKSYGAAMQTLLSRGSGTTQTLTRTGMNARPAEIHVEQDTLYLPIDPPAQRVELEFRVLGYGARPTFTSGRNLGTTIAMDNTFSKALAEIISPGSEIDSVVARAGWRIVRQLEGPAAGDGFRLER